MLSTNVHLAWTFDWNKGEFIKGEVPLWGDKTFGSVDLGTKGFMEEIIMDPLNVLGVGWSLNHLKNPAQRWWFYS